MHNEFVNKIENSSFTTQITYLPYTFNMETEYIECLLPPVKFFVLLIVTDFSCEFELVYME